jgi:hypothetical protein
MKISPFVLIFLPLAGLMTVTGVFIYFSHETLEKCYHEKFALVANCNREQYSQGLSDGHTMQRKNEVCVHNGTFVAFKLFIPRSGWLNIDDLRPFIVKSLTQSFEMRNNLTLNIKSKIHVFRFSRNCRSMNLYDSN